MDGAISAGEHPSLISRALSSFLTTHCRLPLLFRHVDSLFGK